MDRLLFLDITHINLGCDTTLDVTPRCETDKSIFHQKPHSCWPPKVTKQDRRQTTQNYHAQHNANLKVGSAMVFVGSVMVRRYQYGGEPIHILKEYRLWF